MMKKLRIGKLNALSALELLRSPTESVIIRQDVLTTTGETVYTARGIIIVNKTINIIYYFHFISDPWWSSLR